MLKIINVIRKLFSPKDKKYLLGVIFLMMLSALGEMLGLGLLIGVISLFLSPALLQKVPQLQTFFFWTRLSWNSFMILCVLLAGLGMVLKNLFTLFVAHCQAKFIYGKQTELAGRMFRTYLLAPYRFDLECPLAERNTHISRTMELSHGVLLPLMQLCADGMVISLLALVMICTIPWIALGGMCFMLLAAWLTYRIPRSTNLRQGRLLQDARLRRNSALLAGLEGVKTVKAMNKENFFIGGFDREQKQTNFHLAWLYTLGQLPRLALESAALLLLLGIFIIMLQLGKSAGDILLTFSMIVAVMARILPALSRCNYNLTVIRQHQYLFDFVAGQLFQLIPEELGDDPEPLTLQKQLEIRDLNFSYDGKTPVIKHLSLTLETNRSLGISGRTGCGKTTLINLLLGLLRPESGGIFSDGRSIFSNLHSWRGMIGYVPQEIFISSASIRENVAFGVPPEEIRDDRVLEVLKLAQLLDWVESKPGKLSYQLSDGGVNLSGGQRQRIGIARALYTSPQLLILDEATSALDGETEAAFVEALENLNGKFTMIVIAHRLSTIEKCDQRLDLTAAPENHLRAVSD